MSGNVALVTNKGSWNALTNAPAISNSTQNNSAGDYYTTSVAGTSSFTSRGKGQYFAVGDIVVFNGAVWTKNDQFSVESGFGTPSNWKDAYDNHITSGTFSNNVITLNQRDGGSFTIDLTGVGGSSVLYRDSVTVLASGGQNAFTLSASIDSEDKTQVFIDGVYQQKTGYSVSGTTLTFDNSVVVPQGSTVEIISFSSVALTESLANAKIFVGDSNANAIAKTISGDATLANTGALTLNTVPIAKGGTGATSVSAAKTALSLENLDNTSDANKPVSTAGQAALDLKSNIAGPTFTGTPAAPTASAGTNTTQLATTAFVNTGIANIVDSAPGTLNTLNELAAALGDDVNFSTTVTDSIATKLPLAGGTLTGAILIQQSSSTGFTTEKTGGTGSFINLKDNAGSVFIGGVNSEFVVQTPGSSYSNKLTISSGGDATFSGSVALGGATIANGYMLEISSASSGNIMRSTRGSSQFSMYQSNNSDVYMGTTSNNRLRFLQNDGDALTIDTNKNVGIGTTSPSQKLHIYSGAGGGSAPDSRTKLLIEDDGEAYLGFNVPATSFTGIRLQFAGTTKAMFECWDQAAQTPQVRIGSVDGRPVSLQTDNTPRLTVLGTSGNVGIGTNSPDQRLVVNGSIGLSYDGTNSYQGIKRTNVGNEYYVATTSTPTNEIHTFTGSSGAKKLTILEGGNVGIGTASPSAKLSIGGVQGSTIGSNAALLIGNNGAAGSVGNLIQIGLHYNPSGATPASVIGAIFTSTAGYTKSDIFFATRDVTTDTAPIERMRISSGGLATFKSSYIAANQYGGELTVGGSSTAFGIAMKYNQGGATSGTIYCSPGYNNAATTLMLGTGSNTNQLVLKGDGNVGIGSTTANTRLDVVSNTNAQYVARFINTSTQSSTTAPSINFAYSNGSTSYGIVLNKGSISSGYMIGGFNPSNTLSFQVLGNGDVQRCGMTQGTNHFISLSGDLPGHTANQYNCLKTNLNDLHFAAGGVYTGYISYNSGFTDVSDASLKENVEDIPDALSKVKKLRGRYFTWINELQGDKKQVGFIAQEVEEQVPEVVTEGASGTKGVSYGKLTAVLVNAIKEQQTIIEDLKSRIETLEG